MDEPRYRLLMVEDSAEDRASYRRALEGREDPRFEIVEALTGKEALALCAQQRWDCVLLDHVLPDMDGLEFLSELSRGSPELPLPVVVLTGQGHEEVAVRAIRAGAHDYLVKDSDPRELRRALTAAIDRHARRSHRRYRVVVVDDSAEDRMALRRRLAQLPDQFELREAETGEQGLTLCASYRPDCVLLDYELPDMDGLEILLELVHQDEGHGPAVLMLTGHGSETLAVRALKAGAEDYLVKGPALDVLPQAIRAAVEKVELRHKLQQQQQAVERSRNLLQVTLTSIGDGVVSTDQHGHVTFLNPVAERLTGWSTAEASGKPLEEVLVIVDEERRQPVDNPARRALREGRIVGLANHSLLVARDGTEVPIDDSAAPIRDEGGQILGSVLVFRDVTERRDTEMSLRLQSRVLESMTEGVSVADGRGVILYTNPAEDQMFGYARGELVGQHVSVQNHYPPEENQRRVAEVIAHLRERGTWAGEWQNVRKDGTTFVSFARITTLEVAGATQFVCVQEDVTARRWLEGELQRRVEELALADRRKDEFLAMLGHELRNPLAPIRNALHLLSLERKDWGTVGRVREIMERQVGHLVRLVDDLLDVARITQGKVSLQRERLDLVKLARECAADHQPRFEAAQVRLEVRLPEAPLWVSGDPTRLTQVLDNFFTNSLKFTNPGGLVTLELAPRGEQALLAVRDTGVGIPADLLPRVFDVFAQADRSLDRSRGGLGLGLAIVKGLVELHGGTVRAASPGPGHGTEMTVLLPLEPLALPREELTHTPTPPLRRRVLLIEDSADAAESLRMLLELSGCEVRVAGTGDEGVRLALEWGPEVVVCDLGLPVMDGFAVARALRAEPRTAGLRLVALTGYGRSEDLHQARAAGFDDHLVKPADLAALLDKL
jgi:PAS domain S-box-containing protein